MDLQLKGKRALVTGSSSGIGHQIALTLAGEGVDVAVHGRDRARTEEAAAQVAALGVKSVATIGDLMDDAAAKVVADQAVAALGDIDILVNNAGAVIHMGNPSWLEIPADDWLATFNLNVMSALRISQHLAPAMIAKGWGRIINISSIGGTQPRGSLVDYGAAKSALNNMTINMSKTLARDGVTVNAIIPGTIKTPAVARWLAELRRVHGWPDDPVHNERVYTTELYPQPVPRLGRPEEIADAVTMLASPRSGFTTGAMIRVDGGYSISMGV